MEFIKHNFKYIFIFVFTLIGMISTSFSLDGLWNYGFSYAISLGEIPYNDFNMVVTPLYSFLFSFGLFFNNNILVFYIENALLYTFMFYLLFKLFDKKAWFFLILLVLPLPFLLVPSYNLLLILFVILLIYMEENNYNDYFIGIVIAFMILTKQTVGLFMIIPSIIYYYRYRIKLLKRFIGLLIPCLIFIIYFLLTNSFSNFFDLCFLGLFDYGLNNTGFDWNIIVGSILIIISIILFIKHRKDSRYLYILLFSSIMFPLFDLPHLLLYFFVLCMLFIDKVNIKRINMTLFYIVFSMFYLFLYNYHFYNHSSIYDFPNKYDNLSYALYYGNYDITHDNLIKYINSNDDRNIVFLGFPAYFYKIVTNRQIDYFDLLNKGNFGYNGTNKMINRIKKLDKNTIIIVDSYELKKSRRFRTNQIDHKIIDYVVNNYTKDKEIDGYYIYSIK